MKLFSFHPSCLLMHLLLREENINANSKTLIHLLSNCSKGLLELLH